MTQKENPFAVKTSDNNAFASPRARVEDQGLAHGGKFASFGARVVAFFIDRILIGIVVVALTFLGYKLFGDSDKPSELFIFIYMALMFLAWIPGLIYYTITESSSAQASIGKRIMKIKVVDAQGERVSFGRALGRNLAGFFSSFILGIGYLMAAFTEKRQALHDSIASTLVVTADTPDGAVPVSAYSGGSNAVGIIAVLAVVGFIGIAVIGILAAIAIPAYQDYTVRAKLFEAYASTAGTRKSYIDFYNENKQLPASLSNLSESKVENRYVQSIKIDRSGELIVSLTGAPQFEGKTFSLTPEQTTDGIQLVCSSSIRPRLLPTDCRN